MVAPRQVEIFANILFTLFPPCWLERTVGKTLTKAKMVSPSDALHYPQIVSIRELIGLPEPRTQLVRWFSRLWRGVQLASRQHPAHPPGPGRREGELCPVAAASPPTSIFLRWTSPLAPDKHKVQFVSKVAFCNIFDTKLVLVRPSIHHLENFTDSCDKMLSSGIQLD